MALSRLKEIAMAEPIWLTAARKLVGTREAAGPANSPTIMGWAKRLGTKVLGIAYNADSVPWCGLFVAHTMSLAGLPAAHIAVRASAWANYGKPCGPCPGAILVFKREGGGHVGFYVSEDRDNYHVLGGNQSDNVTITKIAKARCVAIRWPAVASPVPGKAVIATLAGTISKNEA
jgi:uncharacterized protein (TIGR02594 family)